MSGGRYGIVGLVAAALLLAGCIGSQQPVEQQSVIAPPLEGLRTLGELTSTFQEVKGTLSLPGTAGNTMLAGQVDEQKVDVPEGALFVKFKLEWTEKGLDAQTSDLDLFIYDAEGRFAGSAASLEDPEEAKVRVTSKLAPGSWMTRVWNYNNPPTDYTITVEVLK